MKNASIERILTDCKRNIAKPVKVEQKKSVQMSIDKIKQICQNKILKDNSNFTADQIYNGFTKYVVEICENYCKTANIKEQLFQLEALKKLTEDKQFVKHEYEKVKDQKPYDFEKTQYTANISGTYTKLVHYALTIIKNTDIDKDNIDEKVINLVKKYSKADRKTRKVLKMQYKNMDFDLLEKRLPVIIAEDYPSKIQVELKILQGLIEKQVKEKQISIMKFLGEFFEDFNFIEDFTKKHTQKTKNFTDTDLQYEVSSEKYDKDSIGVKEIFSEEFLQKQSLEDILTYSLFWQNRFAKVFKDINIAQFAMTDMKLWDKIVEEKKGYRLTDEELTTICKKQFVLSELSAQLISEVMGNVNSEKIIKEQDGSLTKIDISAKVKQYQKQEGKNYFDIFNNISPNLENNLKNDLIQFKTAFNQVENVYTVKDNMLGCKIRGFFDSNRTKNWGIIPEENNTNSLKNKVDVDNEKVLVGIDYEGINMPLRLHINRKLLSDLIRLKNGNVKIPLYDGKEDFVIRDEVVKTNVLMPIPKRHKINIRNRIKELNGGNLSELELLEHLLFLADQDKYPNHLKINGRRLSKRYIDLGTDEIFEKNGASFIKIQDNVEIAGANNGR